MADNPEMVVVDPDAPTEQSVKGALLSLPTWEEWLQQHGFVPQERTRFSGAQWNREWRDQGRVWSVRIAPALDTINVIVYNNPLRYGRQLAMVSVSELSVPKVVQRLLTEIERKVSDATKKRRIRAYTSSVPWEDRAETTGLAEHPRPATDAALRRLGLMRESVEPDPDAISPDQMERALKRVRVHCFIPGQRVRVRRQHAGSLTNAMGTVVDATEHACYVAIDDFVNAGDPDPFRFTEDELEPVYEGKTPDPDAPEPYIAALDYITPLKQLGYSLTAGPRNGAFGLFSYRKDIPIGDKEGRLKIEVEPQKQDVAAVIYVEYASQRVGEIRRVQDILVFSPFDIVDTCRELEKLAFDDQITGISDFADELRKKGYKGTPVTNREHLWQIFGESVEPDDPVPYVTELQRHYEVINAFGQQRAKLVRKLGSDRPFYTLHYYDAGAEVGYDIFLQPNPDQSWTVTASGEKQFFDDTHGEWVHEFEIDKVWEIPAVVADYEALADLIIDDLRSYTGPATPPINDAEPDDLRESDDDLDYEKYAKASAGYNPVQLLTAKELRKIARDGGYRVKSCYHSKRTTGFTLAMTPATDERFRAFQQSADAEAYRMRDLFREALLVRLPSLQGEPTYQGNPFDNAITLHCWPWSGLNSARPEDPNNYTLYVDVMPPDGHQRGPGGLVREGVADPEKLKREAVEPDPDDPQMMLKRARAPKLGDIVNIICPRCGDVHQSCKNWPDNAPKEWGFPCGKCGAHIPLVNVVLDSVDDDLDPQKYANDVLYVDNTLTALGYHFAWQAQFPHWHKIINPQLQFVVFVKTEQFKWQFQIYRPLGNGKWSLRASSPGREFRTIRADLEMWERKARAGERVLPESEEPEVDPTAYALATFDPVQFLKDNGWAFHSQQHFTYYAKTFKLPRPYQLGGMTFTGVQVRVGIERSLFGTVSVGVYMVDDQDSGLGIQGYELSRQQVYPWNEQEQGTAPERAYDNGMSIRRFAQGIEGVIANAKWPENRTAALLASHAVKAEIDRFIKELNKGSAVPLHAAEPVVEAFYPDDPEGAIRQMPQQTYVIFTRSLEEDQEIAEGNFPGEPLEQALGKQLLREIAEANVFDMATLRVIGVERLDDDKYSVRVAFSGEYESDERLRDLIQSTYREAAVAGEFNIEQYRPVPTKLQQVRCLHCGRTIRQENGVWVDPEATGDDSMWRETCDTHDTLTAEHEPDDPTRSSGPVVETLDDSVVPTAQLLSN